jgi:hypothetical protein
MWCIPTVDAEFVACMEDILDLYAEPYQAKRPVVCFDETSKQLIQETRPALPAQPGCLERYDYEYKRNGTRNIFLFFQPRAGYRHLEVTEHRTKRDWAYCMKWLVDEAYPEAECVRVVLDNLNTHTYAALYDTFPPAEARRIRKRLELHFTPKHASWLNMAEIEFSVFARKAWKGYVPDEATLKNHIVFLEQQRNDDYMTVNWRFSTADARVKMESLYPPYSS